MGLLSPWFLLGAVAVGLPLWLHLLERENPVRLPFSSLMFFERRTKSSLKERKLRYLLLLMLRLALYFLLALAFAKPIWERSTASVLSDLPRLHLLVMDTSLSMAYGDRWERAVAAAEGVIDGLAGADRAQILATGPSVSVITQPSGDPVDLRTALRSLQPTPSRNSYGDLADAARSLTPEGNLPVVLHVFSDFQQSAMPARFSEMALPTMVSLEAHDVGREDSPNWTVESVQGTLRLYGDLKPRLEATIAGYGTPQARKNVTLRLDGDDVAAKTAEVPAAGRVTVVFEGFDVPIGRRRGEVLVESGDELPGDDKRLFPLDNTQPQPILFASEDPRKRDLLYYQAALDASPDSPFQVRGVAARDLDTLSPENFALVVLSDIPQLPSRFRGQVEGYIREGGVALVILGPKITLASRAPLYDGAVSEARSDDRRSDRFLLAGEIEGSHPALRQVERFRAVKFFRYAHVEPVPDDDVVARLSNGAPLLIERRIGQGRLLVFASALDNIWNDLPIHPVYVPFVVESARYLVGMHEDVGQTTINSILELQRGRGAGTGVQVFDPDGERVLSLAASIEGEDVKLDKLGFYEVRRTGETELVAVNSDARESNLRPIDEETLQLWQATGRQGAPAAAPAVADDLVKPPPFRVWRIILLLLVLIALVESVVGNWHLKVQREVA
jgi:hypothetical protein